MKFGTRKIVCVELHFGGLERPMRWSSGRFYSTTPLDVCFFQLIFVTSITIASRKWNTGNNTRFMMATVPASAAAGPSTNASKIDRQHQRRWVQLVEAWRTSSPDQAHGAYTRDQLVEEISQHAHTLCRTVRDRHWLLSAFQMGVHAVLFPPPDAADEDADEAARVEQLGQQLLQLHQVVFSAILVKCPFFRFHSAIR